MTKIVKSEKIEKCYKCDNTKLEHIKFDVEDIDDSFEDDIIEYEDGYKCESCDHILSTNGEELSIMVSLNAINDTDIRKTSTNKDVYQGAFQKEKTLS